MDVNAWFKGGDNHIAYDVRRLPAFPTEIAFSVIEEELGRPVREIFAEISERPVAAASLGQV